MKIIGLDGRTYTWKLQGYVPLLNDDRPRSALHKAAKELLYNIYPLDRILEEVHLPGSGELYVDFFIPTRKLMVEVNGEQHYRFIQYFHQDLIGFLDSKKRDKKKRDWAEINTLQIVELPYNETIAQWRERIIHVSS